MAKYISFPHVEGVASRQAHANLPPGTYERELGKEGFYGPATHMYHRHPPTAWNSWEGPLRPRAFDLTKLEGKHGGNDPSSPWNATEILSNGSLRLRYWRLRGPMSDLARNADGDDLIFVHAGAGGFFCDYGHLEIATGDYLVVPRGTMWRLDKPMDLLLIEATDSSYQLPDRGLVGAHAIFDPAVLDVPRINEAFRHQQEDGRAWRVCIKRRNLISTVTYPFNPLDAVGWQGDLAPVRLNIKDIRPLTSHRFHLPPSAHTTFVANRFVVATFAPRPFETDPGAIKVPFFHNNDDYDEVIFYHAGDFFSRDNIRPGMMTFHPCGFTHGPHPKALESMLVQKKPSADEYAVMIDARDALDIGPEAVAVEWPGYAESWMAPTK